MLIKIGTILAFASPFIILIVFSSLPIPDPLMFAPEFFTYVLAGFIIMGFVFGVVSALFYRGIIRGETRRITHELILGIVMFSVGSSLAGALIAIGAYMCRNSQPKRQGTV